MLRNALPILISILPLAFAGCGDGSSPGEYHTLAGTRGADNVSGAVQAPASDDVENPVSVEPGASSPEESSPSERNRADPVDDGVTLVVARVESTSVDETVEPTSREPRIEPLVPEPQLRRERGGALRVSFDDLDLKRVIGIDRPTVDTPRDLPPWLKDLAGKRIRVRGFMKPFEFSEGLTGFTFVRDNGVCCFGPNAKLYDKVQVRLRAGTNTDFIDNTAFDVEGVFRIEPTEFLDELLYFYHLDDAVVLRR